MSALRQICFLHKNIRVTMFLSAGLIFSPRCYSFTTNCISNFLESIQHPEHSWFTYQVADMESSRTPQQGRVKERGLQMRKDGKRLRILWKDPCILLLSSAICKFANFTWFVFQNHSAMLQASKSLWTIHRLYSPYVFAICCCYHYMLPWWYFCVMTG